MDFEFLNHAKFSYVEKLESLGCRGLFEVVDFCFLRLVHLFYVKLMKIVPRVGLEPTAIPKSNTRL